MKQKIISMITLIFISFIMSTQVLAKEGDFPYALTTEDLPDGFELNSTSFSNLTNISQLWKTPSDSVGLSSLTVTDYGSSTDLNIAWLALTLLGAEDVSFARAEKAKNITILTVSTYYVQVKTFIIISSDLTSDFEDVKILLEAQVSKIVGEETPAFTTLLSLFGLNVGVIVIKLKRK